MMARSSILLTGGLGYLGRHLAARLAQEGRRVVLLDRAAVPTAWALPRGCELLSMDIQEAARRPGLLRETGCVIHLACSTIPATSAEDPAADVEANLAGTLRLLDACAQQGVPRVVFSSSGGTVYGPPRSVPIPETHPTEPVSAHGALKRAVELYLHVYHRTHGLGYAALRIGNLYGPFQAYGKRLGAVSTFVRGVMAGEEIQVWGDGSVVRDYVFVDDVVEAMVRVADRDWGAAVFNVGTGRGWSLNEMVRLIERQSGRSARIRHLPPRSVDVSVSVLDARRLHEATGWQPAVTLEDGIRRILAAEYGTPVGGA